MFLKRTLSIAGLWAAAFAAYYLHQKSGTKIGGVISIPKTWWLALTTFQYFIFPWVLWQATKEQAVKHLIRLFIGLWLFRAGVQILLMYGFKAWSPPIGIGFNLFFAVSVIAGTYYWRIHPSERLLSLLWVGLMLTDTLFAWQFYEIVGAATQGERAVWYADDSERFAWINRQTVVANMLWTGLWLYIVWKKSQKT